MQAALTPPSRRSPDDWFVVEDAAKGRDPVELLPDGRIRLRFHAGQREAWERNDRILAVIAGAQGGKSVTGPVWLLREILRRGSGDYLIAAPTFKVLENSAIPKAVELFQDMLGIATYKEAKQQLIFDRKFCSEYLGGKSCIIRFRHAQNPNGLESFTAKAAWLDEPGQQEFKLGSWEAILRRLRVKQGRVYLTTTPYDLGWLKTQVYDRYRRRRDAEESGDPVDEVDSRYWVVNFDSTAQPNFDIAEFEQARREMPPWKFDLFYRGIFSRPAGSIFDCFDDQVHVVQRWDKVPPRDWQRVWGLDFGLTNFAAIKLVKHPKTKQWIVYESYYLGYNTDSYRHVELLTRFERPEELENLTIVGGAPSEDAWRTEFADAGLIVQRPPMHSVEARIGRVYRAFRMGLLFVGAQCAGLIKEILDYKRKTNEYGEVTLEIEEKSRFHRVDALGYAVMMASEIDALTAQQEKNEHAKHQHKRRPKRRSD